MIYFSAPEKLSKTVLGTSEFCLFMDKVFDSVNGSTVRPQPGKDLKCAVTKSSKHMDFWIEAIKMFETIKFYKSNGHKFTPPTVKNWVHTLKGLRYLWPKLNGVGFNSLSLRNLNQDPLENFFGNIRSHGVRNVNPNCSSFINSFKTLIINNFLSPHSPSSNCEEDDSFTLNSLKSFFRPVPTHDIPQFEISNVDIPIFHKTQTTLEKKGKLSYIAGYLAKNILTQFGNCTCCKKELVGNPDTDR